MELPAGDPQFTEMPFPRRAEGDGAAPDDHETRLWRLVSDQAHSDAALWLEVTDEPEPDPSARFDFAELLAHMSSPEYSGPLDPEVYRRITPDQVAASLTSTYVDPSRFSVEQLKERVAAQQWLAPPPFGLLASCSPEEFTRMELVARFDREAKSANRRALKHAGKPALNTMVSTMAALAAKTALASNGKRSCIGTANLACAFGMLSLFCPANGRAWIELLNTVVGASSPERVLRLLVDRCRAVLMITVDGAPNSNEANLNGVTTQTEVSNAIKARILEIFGSQGTVENYEEHSGLQARINAFVERNTAGQIKDIIPKPIDPDVKAILVAAEAIEIKFEKAFNVCPDRDTFYSETGCPKVRNQDYFMRKSEQMLVWEDTGGVDGSGCVAVLEPALPDEINGKRRAMVWILPDKHSTTPRQDVYGCAARLDVAKFVPTKVGLFQAPPIKVSATTDALELLEDLGVYQIFNDLQSMSLMFCDPSGRGGLVVSKATHVCEFKVTRKGAKAEAATVIEISYRSCSALPLEESLTFVCNRPHLQIMVELPDEGMREEGDAGILPLFFTYVGGQLAEGAVNLGHHDAEDALGVQDEVIELDSDPMLLDEPLPCSMAAVDKDAEWTESVERAQQRRWLQQGLVGEDKRALDAHPDQLDPAKYFDADGKFNGGPFAALAAGASPVVFSMRVDTGWEEVSPPRRADPARVSAMNAQLRAMAASPAAEPEKKRAFPAPDADPRSERLLPKRRSPPHH